MGDTARDYIAPEFLKDGRNTWESYIYDETMQTECDQALRKNVAPGHGGIPQELWINAPPRVRTREIELVNVILRTGIVPPILMRKQLMFLPKTAHATNTLDNMCTELPP